jgi:hypothetical protein
MEGGSWSQALLRVPSFWQVNYQDSVNEYYDLYSITVHVAITHIKNQLMHFNKITLF